MLELKSVNELRKLELALQARQNTPSPKPKYKKKKRKTKTKRIKPVRFVETQLGHFLYYRCPIEYKLITDLYKRKRRIDANLVEQVSYASDNAEFKTEKFREALRDFRSYGLRTPNPVIFDMETEVRHIKLKLGIDCDYFHGNVIE